MLFDILKLLKNRQLITKDVNTVKHLPKDLADDYERELKAIGDVDGIRPPLINISDILRAYYILADYFTDASSDKQVEAMLVGVKNRNLLGSAVSRQTVSFGGHIKYTNSVEICSTLFYGLVKNHAFHDGNKRVSLLILLYQLYGYGYFPSAPVTEFEKLVVSVAANTLPSQYGHVWKKFSKLPSKDDTAIQTIAYMLRRMTTRKDHSFHISVTMKEFCSALESQGVKCSLENGKIYMSITQKIGGIPIRTARRHHLPFGGWTRVVGAKQARETLEILGIYDQHPTYQSIMSGKDPLYTLVAHFEEPLRRLKDK